MDAVFRLAGEVSVAMLAGMAGALLFVVVYHNVPRLLRRFFKERT